MNPRNLIVVGLAALLAVVVLVWLWSHSTLDSQLAEVPKAGAEGTEPASPSPGRSVPTATNGAAGGMAEALIVSTMPLPEGLQQYLAGIRKRIGKWTDIPVFRGRALDQLLGEFEACDEPLRASRLGTVLTRTVDPRVVSALTRKLTNGFAGLQLTSSDVSGVRTLVMNLAFNATSDDIAYHFLLSGTTTAFWDRTRRWRCPEMEEYSSVAMAGSCWIALGHSRRSGVYEYLLDYREGRRTLEHPPLAGAVASAAFRYINHERILEQRKETMDIFDDWAKTEKGVKWLQWTPQPQVRTPDVRSLPTSQPERSGPGE